MRGAEAGNLHGLGAVGVGAGLAFRTVLDTDSTLNSSIAAVGGGTPFADAFRLGLRLILLRRRFLISHGR